MTQLITPKLPQPVTEIWDGNTALRCVDVRQETADVRSFFFVSIQPKVFKYQPGQFITLNLPIDGQEVCRTYTLSTSPACPHCISITVKRVPKGIVSNYLHDYMKVGTEITATPPGGIFTFLRHTCKSKLLFLSGGSGITPLMSMSRYLADVHANPDLIFMHSARTPADVIFPHELSLMEKNHSSFKLCLFSDQEDKDWQGETGFLTDKKLKKLVPDLDQREVFCCGPAPYMENVCRILKDLNYNMGHYHQESFTFNTVQADAPKQAEEQSTPSKGQGYIIKYKKLDKEFICDDKTTILMAARAIGLRPPYGCSQGICGTCKTLKISGEIEMEHQGGIRQADIDKGYILPCCSIPKTNVELE